jgi:hypothetical protein
VDWRFAYASVAGRSHVEAGTVCQDYSLCSMVRAGEDVALVLTVSDGAGSAKRSEIGSRLACASFHTAIADELGKSGMNSAVARDQIENWLASFQREVAVEAVALDVSVRDLACTFIGGVIAETWAAFCQIGDGGIVVRRPVEIDGASDDDFEVIFWPESGEYANETYFATLPLAHEHLQFRCLERGISDVAMFSDGLQRLALKFDTQEPFAPFFRNLLRPVRESGSLGELSELSCRLADFLASERVSDRTDDDVTLVLASQFVSQLDAEHASLMGTRGPATPKQSTLTDSQET